MSLIRDALQRQQQDQGGVVPRPDTLRPERETEKVAHPDPRAPTSATPASGSAGTDSPAGGRRWAGRLLLFCGTGILVVAAVLIALWLFSDTPPPDITAQHAPPPAETPPTAAKPESDELPVQPDKEAEALPEALPAFPSAQEEPAEEPFPPEREEELEREKEPERAEESDEPEEPEIEPVESVEPTLDDVVWPEIRISAAMGGSRGGSVLINGEIVPVGQRHGDLLIHEIHPEGVRIEYRGEQRIVPVRR